MAEQWSPTLEVRECGSGCQLWLAGVVCGRGATLQQAADDLVESLLVMVMCTRSSGLTFVPEAPRIDFRWFEFLYELGEIAACGGDIRDRVFADKAA